MTDVVLIAIVSVSIGILVGAVFFGGLRLTVERLATTEHRVRWIIGSAIVRFGLVLGVMVLLAVWHVVAPILALLGFLVARMLVVGRVRRRVAPAPVRRRPPEGS